MPTNAAADFAGKSRQMKLKNLKTRDDMAAVEEAADYHTGVSASVPFMWESQPGTPKVKFRDHGPLLSPLTPPPSYFSTPSPKLVRKSPRTNFLNTVFRKLSVKASLQPLSPGSSSSSSSTTPTSSGRERGKAGSPRRLSFDSRMDEEEEEEEEEETNVESPVSTLFFGRGANDQGCYPKLVKVFTRDFK